MPCFRPMCVVLTSFGCLTGCGSSHTPDDGSAPGADAAPDLVQDSGMPGSMDAGPLGGLPPTCITGTAAPCGCPDGRESYLYCVERRWTACECPPLVVTRDGGVGADANGSSLDGGAAADADTSPFDAGPPDTMCTDPTEWCDGVDNDCDGRVDEGEPCPDSSVRNTLSAEVAVWLQGVPTGGADCALHRVWPAIGTAALRLACQGGWLFRATDDELFYSSMRGVFRRVASGLDEEIPTPPCFGAGVPFGFDGDERFFYQCRHTDGTTRMGNGEIVSHERLSMGGVLSSGNLIMVDGSDGSGYDDSRVFVLMGTDGGVRSTLSIRHWVGIAEPSFVTVVNDTAFVTFRRRYRADTRQEVVIFRVDGGNAEWRLVRRVPITPTLTAHLPLPDGTLLGFTREPSGFQRLLEFPPDGPPRQLLHLEETSVVDLERWDTLLTGPAEYPH